jgi:hypothetical protein
LVPSEIARLGSCAAFIAHRKSSTRPSDILAGTRCSGDFARETVKRFIVTRILLVSEENR